MIKLIQLILNKSFNSILLKIIILKNNLVRKYLNIKPTLINFKAFLIVFKSKEIRKKLKCYKTF